MHIENLEVLTRVLQASISPVALVSGVGLLLLSQTNRFGRVTDRLRDLAAEGRRNPGRDARLEAQVAIFHLRARILRSAIGAGLVCVLLASLMVLVIFAIAVLDAPVQGLVLLLFAASLLALIVSIVLFLWDIHLSLKAVQEFLEGPR